MKFSFLVENTTFELFLPLWVFLLARRCCVFYTGTHSPTTLAAAPLGENFKATNLLFSNYKKVVDLFSTTFFDGL
jgi:hypothetical protein